MNPNTLTHRKKTAKAALRAAFCLSLSVIIIVAAVCGVAGNAALAAENRVPGTKREMQLSFAPLVKKAAPGPCWRWA